MSTRLISGYKRTEVGVVPTDWQVRSLGDLADIATGSTPPTGDASNYGDEFLFVSPGDLGVQKFIRNTEKGLSKKGYSISRRFPKHSVLFVCIGSTIGKCGIASTDLTSNQQINAVFPALSLSSSYLYYVLSQAGPRIRYQAGEQAVPMVNKTRFSETAFALPPTKMEQEAIAAALSDADALIESLEQLIAKKRHIKQGAMQELLQPKDGWVVRTLSQLADIRSGGTPSTNRAEYWDGGVPWCTPTDITALKGHKYLTTTSRTITSHGLKASSAEMIPSGSVVMTSRATIGECAINRVPLATNQGFKNFVPFQGMDAEFLYYLLLTKKQDFVGLCSGSTFLEIGKTQLVGFEVALPTQPSEQTAIATILSDMDAELTALEAKLTKTRQLKQGMMRELLTGRIRLV